VFNWKNPPSPTVTFCVIFIQLPCTPNKFFLMTSKCDPRFFQN
jgi:hypothetical protein